MGYITLPWIWIHLPPTNIRDITFVSCNKTRFSWRMRRTYLSHFIIPNIWCLTLDHKSNVFVLCTAKIQPPQHADEHNEANSFIKLHLNFEKTSNFTVILLLLDGFGSYLHTSTLMTRPSHWLIDRWPWPPNDLCLYI